MTIPTSGLPALLGLAMAPALALAARIPVDCRVEAGFGGTIRDRGGVFPVAVTIENMVASTAGLIEISQPDASGSAEVTYALPFTTPAPSVKRFVLLVRAEAGRDLMLDIRFKDSLKNIHRKIDVRRAKEPLVACLGMPSPTAVGDVGRKYRFVGIARDALPDDPQGLDGLHAVLVSDSGFAMLSPEQVGALRRWTLTGGTLVVQNSADPSFARNLKALTAGIGFTPRRASAGPFGAGVLALPQTDSLLSPPFWESDPPVSRGSGDLPLVRLLFPSAQDEESLGFSGTGILTDLWSTRRTYGVWAFLCILAIVGAYVLVIGPLDRWLVRRFRRPYLTWIFFPAAIGLFSMIAFGYSSLVNVGSMRAVYVNVLDTAADADTARGNSQIWVYSTQNATYTLETDVENTFFSARESAVSAGAVAAAEIQNARKSVLSARIPVFSSKTFDATWYAPWTHRIACRREGGRLHVSVPDGLKVKQAYLADAEGLTPLRATNAVPGAATREYVSVAARRKPWETALLEIGPGLRRSHYYGGPALFEKEEGLLPDSEKLRNYLICMSAPWKMSGEKLSEHYEMAFLAQARDLRERSLDIRSRLAAGRVLFLFLEPSHNTLPLRIRLHAPMTERVDLVRVQLP